MRLPAAAMYEYRGVKIAWLGHDAFRLTNGAVVYIDPYKIPGGVPADLILISHGHFDHLSVEDVKKVASSQTTIITVPAAARELEDDLVYLGVKQLITIQSGGRREVKGVQVEAVPAYNVNKFRAPGEPFHPKAAGGVGFIVTMGGVRIYHTGDSDFVSEMKGLQVDVALLPVSGTYVMTAEEAAAAANEIRPKVAIPMHYGSIVGSAADAERFRKLAKCDVQILSKE